MARSTNSSHRYSMEMQHERGHKSHISAKKWRRDRKNKRTFWYCKTLTTSIKHQTSSTYMWGYNCWNYWSKSNEKRNFQTIYLVCEVGSGVKCFCCIESTAKWCRNVLHLSIIIQYIWNRSYIQFWKILCYHLSAFAIWYYRGSQSSFSGTLFNAL